MGDINRNGNEDLILPSRLFDSTDVHQKISLDLTLRFDEVLDPKKLHSALVRLVQIGNWHQIGARYKKNVGTRESRLCTLQRPRVLTTVL